MRHVVLFKDLTPKEISTSGGKGATLAKLYQRGFPVPNGCVILPHAFLGDELCPEAAAELKVVVDNIKQAKRDTSFAVRSSAMGEDSTNASFAGGFLSILKVNTFPEVLDAVHAVRQSAGEERVTSYAQTQGLAGLLEMAVVVQELVEAELAGVMFCKDPLSSDNKSIVGNYTTGLGEALVAGDVDAQTFSIYLPTLPSCEVNLYPCFGPLTLSAEVTLSTTLVSHQQIQAQLFVVILGLSALLKA